MIGINSTLLTREHVADELKPHWTNQSLHHDQGQGTPTVILTASTEEVSCGRSQHLPQPLDIDTSILARKTWWMYCLIRGAVEIRLHPNNLNQEYRFFLSRLWKPHTNPLKKVSRCLPTM
jgi:hypothetical protein